MENSAIFFILLIVTGISANVCNDAVCCASSCSNCTTCGSENISISEMCCENNILAKNLSCADHPAPCVGALPYNPTVLEQFIAFMDIPNIVFISICGVLFIALMYACICFDSRKPPLKYNEIAWKDGISWIKDE